MSRTLAVDIVVDNFNYARYLATAIDSALAQTHPRCRVIAVDDGSTDESREILARYGRRITSVFKDNGGQASAFNAGWAECDGDIVIFLDADDVLLPHAAARAAAVFAASPRVVKLQYRLDVIDGAGNPTGALWPPAYAHMPAGELWLAELTFPFDLTWVATSGNAFRAMALRRIMPIPEADFTVCADYYLKHLTPLLGQVASLAEVCARYRVHGGNSYQLATPVLDLDYVRKSVRYAAVTRHHLRRMANELGLPAPGGPILSVADLANRIISRRLAPEAHPLAGDRLARLALAGVVAAIRRFDIRWPMKLLFAGWFAAMVVGPRPAARVLATLFLFPERRRPINLLLTKLRRPEGRPS